MNLLPPILSEILVFQVDVSNGIASTKTSAAKYSLKKDHAIILQEVNEGKSDRSKKKNGVAVVIITGNDVGSKEHEISGDEVFTKITENDNLLWTIHEENDNRRIDFIRKSSLGYEFNEIDNKKLYLGEVIVSHRTNIDTHLFLKEFYETKVNFNLVKKSKEFRAFFFDSLFDKIKLPVLIIFFVLLLINYLVFSSVKEKYEISEIAYNIQLQKNKQDTEISEKVNRLLGDYNKIQSYPLALMSDRIASYIPKDVRLTSITFFPERAHPVKGKAESITNNTIVIKGKAGIPGTILLLTQYLREDTLFKNVDIINIDNLKNNESYDFELRVTLWP